jgi:hypothetical protein
LAAALGRSLGSVNFLPSPLVGEGGEDEQSDVRAG